MIAVFAIPTPDGTYNCRSAATAIRNAKKIGTSTGGISHSRISNLRVSDIRPPFQGQGGSTTLSVTDNSQEARGDFNCLAVPSTNSEVNFDRFGENLQHRRAPPDSSLLANASLPRATSRVPYGWVMIPHRSSLAELPQQMRLDRSGMRRLTTG